MRTYMKRHISVSPNERLQLEEAKRRYEEKYGSADWGGFLAATVGLGLAALGVYAMAKVRQQSEKSAKVTCPKCGFSFVLAIPTSKRTRPIILEFNCPDCSAELAADLEASVHDR